MRSSELIMLSKKPWGGSKCSDHSFAYSCFGGILTVVYFFRNFIITKKTPRHPYNTRSRKMDNEEGVQEQMKADLSALKDQMASISEVMLKLQKTIEDKATATASSTVREAEPVLQPALNPGLDRNTAVFGRRYSPQAYPYGLPPDFTPRATPEDLSQAPTFEGQLPPYEDYPGQDDGEGDTHLGPLLHLKDPSPHELPQPNIVRHIPASPTPVKESVPFAEDKGKIEALEERLRAVEGLGNYPFSDLADLCLVPNIVIPPKFKVPDFDKYKGTTCPKGHLRMYCRKMGAYSADEKLLVHFFQDSLAGAAVAWYTNLEASQIRSWKDLATAFIRQYQYNTDMAPDRNQLQSMTKREHESIKEYAQRWRDLAAQVVPPMTEREMITIMVDTLPTFYYEKLIGYMPANFADLVFAGERIESGLRKGKFEYASNVAPNNNRRAPVVGARKKEGDAHAVTTAPMWMKAPQNIQSSYQPNPPNFLIRAGNSLPTQVKGPPAAERASAQRTAPAAPRPVNNTAPGATYKYAQHPKDNFPPIPMAYSELWPSLLENHLVVAIPGKVFQPPYPKWYNSNATCAYHSGAPGHNIDSCLPFKYKVQHLINVSRLSFQEEGPNVKTNPLASHGGASVNAIEKDRPSGSKRLEDVATSRRFIYQSLQAACMVSRGGDKRDECLFHLGESHDMETCPAVEELLQRLMDCGQLEVSIGGREEPQICMQSEEKKVPLTPKALVICFTRKGTGSTPIYPRAAPKPTPFAYQSNKAVPWKYTPPASSERVATEVDSLSAKVTNITGLSGVTRSGRVFASPHPAELPSKGKAPMVQEPTDIATPSKEVDPPVVRGAEKKEGLQGKTVTLEEAHEFLRLIQQSEFKVVEQLNKTPARISLLELLINSEPHRALLMKVLNDAHVAHDISVEGFEGIVNHITTNNYIAFAEEEIPVEGRGHNKALHVSVRCMDHVVAKVLIDNGSSLNVMPKTTLEKLPFSASRLKPSSMVVRAFDGTRREVMGEIDIPIQIGPHTCNVVFQVMDINPAYSCLLGRPWIHALGVVPSTLHQKLKFAVGGLLVIVSGEEDMLVSCPSSAPYVEAAEESLETAFQSFEVVSCASVEPSPSLPSLSKAAIMVARVMLRNGFEPGMGLGKDCLGNADVVDIKGNPYKYGLGYEPGMPGRRNVPSRFRADRVWPGRISQCFTSAGMVSEEEVAAIEEEFPQDPPSFVQPCHPDSQVGNWRVISQSEVYTADSM